MRLTSCGCQAPSRGVGTFRFSSSLGADVGQVAELASFLAHDMVEACATVWRALGQGDDAKLQLARKAAGILDQHCANTVALDTVKQRGKGRLVGVRRGVRLMLRALVGR
jgi:hypothetical protein